MAGIETATIQGGMDFELSEDLVALQDVARDFAAEHINAHAWQFSHPLRSYHPRRQ